MEQCSGDNFFHYLSLLITLKQTNSLDVSEDIEWFNEELSKCQDNRTGYIHRRNNHLYPNANSLEISHDELSAITYFGDSKTCEDLERRINKFRGWYSSHLRNRVYMGMYMGFIASLKLRNDSSLSLPWQLLWCATTTFSDAKDPSSMLLLYSLIEHYRRSGFRNRIMTYFANKGIDKINNIKLECVMYSFWKEENLFTELSKGVTLEKI